MNSKFVQFERDIMKKILSENPNVSDRIEKQYESSKVISREFTGVGFFTKFEIFDTSLRLPHSPNLVLGDAHANIQGLEYGAGFILFVTNGLISTLEGYSYGEIWPENIEQYTIE